MMNTKHFLGQTSTFEDDLLEFEPGGFRKPVIAQRKVRKEIIPVKKQGHKNWDKRAKYDQPAK